MPYFMVCFPLRAMRGECRNRMLQQAHQTLVSVVLAPRDS
jgi:hypothetical protein